MFLQFFYKNNTNLGRTHLYVPFIFLNQPLIACIMHTEEIANILNLAAYLYHLC